MFVKESNKTIFTAAISNMTAALIFIIEIPICYDVLSANTVYFKRYFGWFSLNLTVLTLNCVKITKYATYFLLTFIIVFNMCIPLQNCSVFVLLSIKYKVNR